MAFDVPTAIAYVGAFVGLVGGGVGLFNSWMAFRWKRAELANGYMKDFNNNEELVFAGRCLDWNGGKLVLPESLRAYMPNNEKFIEHDRRVFAQALAGPASWRHGSRPAYPDLSNLDGFVSDMDVSSRQCVGS